MLAQTVHATDWWANQLSWKATAPKLTKKQTPVYVQHFQARELFTCQGVQMSVGVSPRSPFSLLPNKAHADADVLPPVLPRSFEK